MARITVVIFVMYMSSSVFCNDAGMHHATDEVHNVTGLEKRSPMMKRMLSFDCSKAEYKYITLYDFIYKHGCFPLAWGTFVNQPEVKQEINVISTSLFYAAQDKEPKTRTGKPIAGDKFEPSMGNMFNAFTVRPEDIKVVILGQDPTPQAGKATGVAFSLWPGEDPRTVPSVLNMLVELKMEGFDVDLTNGDLTPWKGQGVLLLNAALTVKQGNIGSHQNLWQDFTKLLVQYISKQASRSAWLLWGGEAQAFAGSIDTTKHYIKAGGHPSPFSANNFFGGNYFHCANRFLNEKAMRSGVVWSLGPVSPVECNLPAS